MTSTDSFLSIFTLRNGVNKICTCIFCLWDKCFNSLNYYAPGLFFSSRSHMTSTDFILCSNSLAVKAFSWKEKDRLGSNPTLSTQFQGVAQLVRVFALGANGICSSQISLSLWTLNSVVRVLLLQRSCKSSILLVSCPSSIDGNAPTL